MQQYLLLDEADAMFRPQCATKVLDLHVTYLGIYFACVNTN